MGELQDGRFISDTEQAILDALMADARTQFGDDLNDDDAAVIRMFYLPVARRLAHAQQNIGLILDSAQIEHAEGAALDLLTALIGVPRRAARKATGSAKVYLDSRDSVDHNVPSGTVVATNAEDPVRFVTTASRTIKGPSTVEDTSTYATSNTAYTTKTSFIVDVTHRDTLDVSADIRTTDGTTPVAADLEIADATNATQIHTGSTTNTSFTTSGPTTYDVSALEGDLSIEYRIKSNDSTVSVEMTNATLDKQAEIAANCPIKAEVGGTDSNVGKQSITTFPDGRPFPGANVTNPKGTSGGTDREADEDLRDRAQDELANGARATGPALVSNLLALREVYDVTIFINDTNTDNYYGNGLPAHSFELVVACETDEETQTKVAQTIMNTKGVATQSVTGTNGDGLDTTKDYVTSSGKIQTDLPNEQQHPVGYSLSATVDIYVDIDLVKTSEYEGDDAVRDSIVEYIGGIKSTGTEQDGKLDVGDDVIHSQVQGKVTEIAGVHDINHVYIDTTTSPTSTSNITIATAEQAFTDARSTDQHITMTTSNK